MVSLGFVDAPGGVVDGVQEARLGGAGGLRLRLEASTGLVATRWRVDLRDGVGATLTSVTVPFSATTVLDRTLLDPTGFGAGSRSLSVVALDAADRVVAARDEAFVVLASAPIVIEAEAGVLINGGTAPGMVVVGPGAPDPGAPNGGWAGASQGAYVDFGAGPGDGVAFAIAAPQAGLYRVTLRYANGDPGGADRPLDLRINGGPAAMASFPCALGPGSWAAWSTIAFDVALRAGANTLSLTLPQGARGGPNLDRLTIDLVAAATPRAPSAPTLSGPPPAENAAGALAGLLSSIDPDGGPVVFSTTDPRFVIVGDALRLRPGLALDHEAGGVSVRVRATDAEGASSESVLSIRAADAPEAPTLAPGLRLPAVVTPAGAAARIPLPRLGAADPDAGPSPVLGVSSSGGGAPPVGVRIEGGVLILPATLAQGALALEIFASDGVLRSASVPLSVTVGPPATVLTLQAEAARIIDVGDPGPQGLAAMTVVRGAAAATAVGGAFVDYGANPGDGLVFSVSAPETGLYRLALRYANGGGERSLAVSVDGGSAASVRLPFTPGTGGVSAWTAWSTATTEVALRKGDNQLTLAIPNGTTLGANLDQIRLELLEARPPAGETGPRDTIRFDFGPGATPVSGALAAPFLGFGDRGGGWRYGFVTDDPAVVAAGGPRVPVDPALFPADAAFRRTGAEGAGVDPRLTGAVALDRPDYPGRVAFEVALPAGWYEVTAAIGDAAGPNDSLNAIRIEGATAARFVPTNAYKTAWVTAVVEVRDGALTVAAPEGERAELQHLEIRALPDLTPGDARAAPADYPAFVNPVALSGEGAGAVEIALDPTRGAVTGVDPSASLVLGVNVVGGRGGVLLASLTDGSIRLIETRTGLSVPFSANTTAGFDSVTITPSSPLKPFTGYSLIVDGARDRGPTGAPGEASRDFLKFSTSFATGAAPPVTQTAVAFSDSVVAQGFILTSVEMAPDGLHLYAASLGGAIQRWDVDPATGALSNPQTLALSHFQGPSGPRGIVGLAFDPVNPRLLWVTDNDPIPLNGRDEAVPDFSGRVSRILLGEGPAFTGTAETYVRGLPRSNGDHVTNSLEFRVNPDAGGPSHLLYLTQGSNTAMGAADSAWGFRPERLLNGAVLEIDPGRTPPPGGFDVTTEPLPGDGKNRRFGYDRVVDGRLQPGDDGNLKNGGIAIDSGPFTGAFLHFDAKGVASVRAGADPGSALLQAYYDPFAPGAVARIFSTGVRNAYDLVWHSNGLLYVPTNGSAAGGAVPNDPRTTTVNEGRGGVERQDDYLFTIERGAYSGHPNPLQDRFILNGGNPTAGVDPNEVLAYPVGIRPDPDYDPARAYSLGPNRSANGVIEYRGDAFGGALRGAVLFAQYSAGDDVRGVRVDAQGRVTGDFRLQRPDGSTIVYTDPLDLIEGRDGRIYLLTLERATGRSLIVRLNPAAGTADTTADAEGDLRFETLDAATPARTILRLVGVDPDIVSISIDARTGASYVPVTLDALGRVVVDLSQASGNFPPFARLEDRAGNVDIVTLASGTPTGYRAGSDGVVAVDGRSFAVHEAERGALTGGGVVPGTVENRGASGGGFARFAGAGPASVTWLVDAAQTGAYALEALYALAAGEAARPMRLSVNGAASATLGFAANSDAAQTRWGAEGAVVALRAGVNVVTLTAADGRAPALDLLRVSTAPVDPTPALIAGAGRLDLDDGLAVAMRLGPTEARFSFTVAADGFYALALDRGGASAPGSLTASLAAQGSGPVALGSAGLAGPRPATFHAELEAGVAYALTVALNGADAAALDGLTLRRDEGAALGIRSLDGAIFADRLHFSAIDDPSDPSGRPVPPRAVKTEATLRLTNDGVAPLIVEGAEIDGPFTLANPGALVGLTLAPGASTEVAVRFDRAAYAAPTGATGQIDAASTLVEGTLRLRSNARATPVAEVSLAAIWQPRPESGLEPNLNELFGLFGLGNRIEGMSALAQGRGAFDPAALFVARDETEVLSPFWRIADGWSEARVTALSAHHGPTNAGAVAIHDPASRMARVNLFQHDGADSQAVLPRSAAAGGGRAETMLTAARVPDAWRGDDAFAIMIETYSSNPQANPVGATLVDKDGLRYTRIDGQTARAADGRLVPISSLDLAQQGHLVRVFRAVDAEGRVIPDTYVAAQEYEGGVFDHQDNLILLQGIAPIGFGRTLAVSGLDAAAADARLAFSRVDAPDASATLAALGGQRTRDVVTLILRNDGFLDATIASTAIEGPSAAAFRVESAPTTLAAGRTSTITLRYLGEDPALDGRAALHEARLVIRSDAYPAPETVIRLSGVAMDRAGPSEAPTPAQIAGAFGYVIDAPPNTGGLVATLAGDEIAAPYLRALDPARPIEIAPLGAFAELGLVSRIGWHAVDAGRTTALFTVDDQQGQTLAPGGHRAGPGEAGRPGWTAFVPGAGFGLRLNVDGRPGAGAWSDPAANDLDPLTGAGVAQGYGQSFRFFAAHDAAERPLEGVVIGVADQGGGQFDHNDLVFALRNVTAHALTHGEDLDRDGVNDALRRDTDSDGLPDFFDWDLPV
jgi:hypothetical protein